MVETWLKMEANIKSYNYKIKLKTQHGLRAGKGNLLDCRRARRLDGRRISIASSGELSSRGQA